MDFDTSAVGLHAQLTFENLPLTPSFLPAAGHRAKNTQKHLAKIG
jgi:hypothetical protein